MMGSSYLKLKEFERQVTLASPICVSERHRDTDRAAWRLCGVSLSRHPTCPIAWQESSIRQRTIGALGAMTRSMQWRWVDELCC
jgi:hypothetical protein